MCIRDRVAAKIKIGGQNAAIKGGNIPLVAKRPVISPRKNIKKPTKIAIATDWIFPPLLSRPIDISPANNAIDNIVNGNANNL